MSIVFVWLYSIFRFLFPYPFTYLAGAPMILISFKVTFKVFQIHGRFLRV